jgi:hypothetical protein
MDQDGTRDEEESPKDALRIVEKQCQSMKGAAWAAEWQKPYRI